MGQLHRTWMGITPKSEINKSQFFTLMAIKTFKERNPGTAGATVKDLAIQSGRSPAGISQKISMLEELGYIEREPDKNDKRVVYFNVTPLGVKVHLEIHSQLMDVLDTMIEKMGTDAAVETTSRIQELCRVIKETQEEMGLGAERQC